MPAKLPDVIPLSDLGRSESEREILALLARGDREIAEGMGFDLDDVLAEADQHAASS